MGGYGAGERGGLPHTIGSAMVNISSDDILTLERHCEFHGLDW